MNYVILCSLVCMVPITKINRNMRSLIICLCLRISMYVYVKSRPSRSSSPRQSSPRRSSRPRPAPTSAAKPVPTTATKAVPACTATQAPGRQAIRQGRQQPFQEGHNRRQVAYVPEDRHHQQVARDKGQHPQVVRRRELPFHRQNYSEDRSRVYIDMSSGSPTTFFLSTLKL